MFTRSATVTAALAGVALLLAAPAAAHADDLEEAPVVVVEETPAPDAPVDEPTPAAPVEDEAPLEEPVAPVEEEPVETAPETPPVVTTPPVQTKTLKWVLPAGGNPDNVTWPQPVFSAGSIPCGTSVWVQVDVYPYTTPEDQARTDALDDDGLLLLGEDHGWAQSWTFERFSAAACVPEPEPEEPTVPTEPETPAQPETPAEPVTPPAAPVEPVVETVAQDLTPSHGLVDAELAETGPNQGILWTLGGLGAALLAAGGLALRARHNA